MTEENAQNMPFKRVRGRCERIGQGVFRFPSVGDEPRGAPLTDLLSENL